MPKYENYVSNLSVLRRAPEQNLENEFVQGGIIDKFTMQFELAWKLLKNTLDYEGQLSGVSSPRGVIKAAYAAYDFIGEDTWLAMLDDRNKAQDVYDSEQAERLVGSILDSYIGEFDALLENLEALYGPEVLKRF